MRGSQLVLATTARERDKSEESIKGRRRARKKCIDDYPGPGEDKRRREGRTNKEGTSYDSISLFFYCGLAAFTSASKVYCCWFLKPHSRISKSANLLEVLLVNDVV